MSTVDIFYVIFVRATGLLLYAREGNTLRFNSPEEAARVASQFFVSMDQVAIVKVQLPIESN